MSGLFLGINLHVDPSVAIVREGRVIAFSEEERHNRDKHALGRYPAQALQHCLASAGAGIEDVTALAVNWDLHAYADGRIAAFYDGMRRERALDPATIAWQDGNLRAFEPGKYQEGHHREWRRLFGARRFPRLHAVPHHYTHAFQAFMQSPFEEALCLTLDGSGDEHCSVVWRCRGSRLTPIHEIRMPHSLGWFYAAFTEYLGFQAYDGEYKVMGLAAYGAPDAQLMRAVARVLHRSPDGSGYVLEPKYIHDGPHAFSGRFSDHLSELLGRPPRRPGDPLDRWHRDLAYAVQDALEREVIALARRAIAATGVRSLCVGGGIAQNIKLNSRLLALSEVDDLFAHPLCGDSGAAAGAALAACFQLEGHEPERLTTLALGPEQSDDEIEAALQLARVDYERPSDLCGEVAEELARGRIVGWFQGRMEAGPRALGQRSILADPRQVEVRDRVNAIIKFRELWRPFCPSLPVEAAAPYFERYREAPFMNIALTASAKLARDAPAIVHVDGTARLQTVRRDVNPRFHRLLLEFGRRTGVPVLLNTSFNVKGEPIVCTISDALRTFWSTGLELLAAGSFLVRKPRAEARP